MKYTNAPKNQRVFDAGSAITLLFCIVIALRASQGWTDRVFSGQLGTLPDLLTVAIGVLAAFRPRSGRNRITAAGSLASVYLIVCAVSAIHVATTISLEMAIYGLRAMTIAVGTVMLLQFCEFTFEQYIVLRRALILSVVANLVVAIKQAIFGYSVEELAYIASNGSTYLVGEQIRLIGLQSSGQDFSLIAGAAAVWGLSSIILFRRERPSKSAYAVAFLGVATSVLALQRSILLGVALSIVVVWISALFKDPTFAFVKHSIRIGVTTVAASAVLLLVSSIVAPGQTSEAISRIFSFGSLGTDTSWAARSSHTIPVAIQLFKDNPFGYGVGTSGPVAASLDGSPLAAFPLGGVSPDNGYFLVLLQVGILGFAAFIALLISWSFSGRLFSGARVATLNSMSILAFICGSMISGSFWALGSTMTIVLWMTSFDLRFRESAGTAAIEYEPTPD